MAGARHRGNLVGHRLGKTLRRRCPPCQGLSFSQQFRSSPVRGRLCAAEPKSVACFHSSDFLHDA